VTLLETKSLSAFYGDFQALFGVDLTVAAGEVIGLIGANGAGKTTLLRAITGILPAPKTAVTFQNQPIGGTRTEALVKRGIAMVPEGRKLFPSLSVEENLHLGASTKRQGAWTLQKIFELFPILQERRSSPATKLSGGQQQMVAIGRALMSNPTLLLCDEISLGLAPIVIADVYRALPAIRAAGTAIIVVEQDINQVLRVADRVYCLREGRVVLQGSTSGMNRQDIADAYFGAPARGDARGDGGAAARQASH
jgi:branched-chain amino acid transport system ATP-binding protein